MSTTTPKLGLVKPAGSDTWDYAAHQNANWQRLDDVYGVVECTSATRPVSPVPGMIIRESDTLRSWYRNAANSSWLSLNGVPIVNNTTDVTAPVNGQVVFSFTGFGLWVYKSSTATWIALSKDDHYTLRQGTNTNIGGGWTSVPFATTIEGNNQGISTADNITFTLNTVGLWSVKAAIIPNGNAGCVAALVRGSNADPFNAANTEIYSITSGSNAGSVAGVTLAADIRVDGGSTKTVRVSAFASGLSLYAAGNPGRSRLTFRWSPP